jgi:hypothetical protein
VLGLESFEPVLRLRFGSAGLGILIVDLGAPPIDHAQDRLIKKSVQQPDENCEIERLQRKGRPFEMHRQPA